MDFKVANEYVQRIEQGENGELLKKLSGLCLPYFLSLRKRLGFYGIPESEVRNELTSDAISKAFIDQKRRGLPYSFCLHNAFRDCCRERLKSIREQYNDDIFDKIIHQRYIPPDYQAQVNEIEELVSRILEDHEPLSKQVVFQKMKGSTYPEMAEIFRTTSNECKRVYWHDFNDIQKKVRHLN